MFGRNSEPRCKFSQFFICYGFFFVKIDDPCKVFSADMVSSLFGLNLSGARRAEQYSLLKSKVHVEVDNHANVMLRTTNMLC